MLDRAAEPWRMSGICDGVVSVEFDVEPHTDFWSNVQSESDYEHFAGSDGGSRQQCSREQLDIVRALEERVRLEENEKAHKDAIMGEQNAQIAHLEEKVRALEYQYTQHSSRTATQIRYLKCLAASGLLLLGLAALLNRKRSHEA